MKKLCLIVLIGVCSCTQNTGNYYKDMIIDFRMHNEKDLVDFIKCMDASVFPDTTFMIEYRPNSNRLYPFYLDSNDKRGAFFNLRDDCNKLYSGLAGNILLKYIRKDKALKYYSVNANILKKGSKKICLMVFPDSLAAKTHIMNNNVVFKTSNIIYYTCDAW